MEPLRAKNEHMAAIGRLGGRKGGLACTAAMTPEELSARAFKGAVARWGFVVEGGKRVYKISEATRRKRAKANQRMPWPDPPEFIPRSSSPTEGFGMGGSRGKWTQPKNGK